MPIRDIVGVTLMGLTFSATCENKC